jgi:hypothetical protein
MQEMAGNAGCTAGKSKNGMIFSAKKGYGGISIYLLAGARQCIDRKSGVELRHGRMKMLLSGSVLMECHMGQVVEPWIALVSWIGRAAGTVVPLERILFSPTKISRRTLWIGHIA